jgi:hypothetical protein
MATTMKSDHYQSRREAKEHVAGYRNGLRHGGPIHGTTEAGARALWADNARKATEGVFAEEPLIRAYWNGYTLGMQRIAQKHQTTKTT